MFGEPTFSTQLGSFSRLLLNAALCELALSVAQPLSSIMYPSAATPSLQSQALRAMYPEDEGCLVLQPTEQQALAAATAALEASAGQGSLPSDMYLTNLSGTVM